MHRIKLKILSINFGLSGFAGDSNQLFTITKNLISLGHDVTIITTDADVWRGDSEKSKQYSKIRKILQNSIFLKVITHQLWDMVKTIH